MEHFRIIKVPVRFFSNFLFIVIVGFIINGCSSTVPVLIMENNKEVMRGHKTVSPGTGFIEISKYTETSKLICSGTFSTYTVSSPIEAEISCNDGRKGKIYMYHDAIGQSGHGTITLNDGYKANVIYGNIIN